MLRVRDNANFPVIAASTEPRPSGSVTESAIKINADSVTLPDGRGSD